MFFMLFLRASQAHSEKRNSRRRPRKTRPGRSQEVSLLSGNKARHFRGCEAKAAQSSGKAKARCDSPVQSCPAGDGPSEPQHYTRARPADNAILSTFAFFFAIAAVSRQE